MNFLSSKNLWKTLLTRLLGITLLASASASAPAQAEGVTCEKCCHRYMGRPYGAGWANGYGYRPNYSRFGYHRPYHIYYRGGMAYPMPNYGYGPQGGW